MGAYIHSQIRIYIPSLSASVEDWVIDNGYTDFHCILDKITLQKMYTYNIPVCMYMTTQWHAHVHTYGVPKLSDCGLWFQQWLIHILMYSSHELLTLEFLLQLGSGHDNDETLIGNHRYSTSVVTIACTITSLGNMCCVIITGVLTYKALLRRKIFVVFIVVHSTTIFQWMYDCINWKYKYTSMLPQRISHKWPFPL